MNKSDVEMAIRVINHYKSESNTPHIIVGCEFAISALEKQMPKKPTDIDRDCNYFECASCGDSICSTEKLESHKFCLNCGQAIDWEDEDE